MAMGAGIDMIVWMLFGCSAPLSVVSWRRCPGVVVVSSLPSDVG